jgi:hypothetical protein
MELEVILRTSRSDVRRLSSVGYLNPRRAIRREQTREQNGQNVSSVNEESLVGPDKMTRGVLAISGTYS